MHTFSETNLNEALEKSRCSTAPPPVSVGEFLERGGGGRGWGGRDLACLGTCFVRSSWDDMRPKAGALDLILHLEMNATDRPEFLVVVSG